MTHEREGATVTGEESRADVLVRLARLTDPETDDRTRAEQMRAVLGRLGGPALLVDLDGTVLDGTPHVTDLGVDRSAIRGRSLWAAPLWHLDDATA